MKTKIGVFGSCITRDVFNSKFVHNYKEFFEVGVSAQRTSIISAMQEPFQIDEELITVYPKNRKNNIISQFIQKDLDKSFLKDMLENEIDYLIIDNYFEVRMGILYINNNIITNNVWHLPRTELYKNSTDKLILKMVEYPEEYFCIWQKYCDLLFKFIKIYCPNVKVILNKGRQIDKVIKSDNTIYIKSRYTRRLKINNPLLDKLDSYIEDNFDVHVIDFDYENTFLDENHLWGWAPVHYHRNFHYSFVEKLKDIVKEDNIKKNDRIDKNYDKEEFRKELNRAHNETKLLLKHIKKQDVNDSLKFYNRGRIDILNHATKDNTLKVIESNIPSPKIKFPKYLKSENGQGINIQNEESPIDLKLMCINDGILKIYLRGPYVTDKNSTMFPVYIDYINFTVNNEPILKNRRLVSHSKPFKFEKEVKDSEIIDLHIEWLPFNPLSTYKK